MKRVKTIIIFLLIFIISIAVISIYPVNSVVKINNDNKILNVENSIIIKGIESDTDDILDDNDKDNREGAVIYNDSFTIQYAGKQPDRKTLKNGEYKGNLLEILKEKDNRWHLTEHKIVKEENLWTIAKKYQTDYKIIIEVNEITVPDILNAGNIILVPNRIGVNHKVYRNDTIISLSKKYRVRKEIIVAHNRVKNDLIKEGEFLFIPDATEESEKKIETPEDSLIEKGEDNIRHKFLWPLKGQIISAYGRRIDPVNNKPRYHCGLDIGVNTGTTVIASSDGEAIFSGWKNGYGRVVILKHSGGYITVYANNKENLVNAGDVIKKGEIIALSGTSGEGKGPHLHFEIRKYLTPLNPLRMLM